MPDMSVRTPTDAEIDESMERARAFVASMPVEPGPSQLIAAMVALIETADERSTAARAFATAASQLSGGLACITISYADPTGLVEVIGQAGVYTSTAADRAARADDSEMADSDAADAPTALH